MAEKLCYYCGAGAVSREHAPAKQMFKGFTCDSITVPSCAQHNANKSGADDVIVKGMLIALHQVADRYPSNVSVKTAIEVAAHHFDRVKRKVTPFNPLADPPLGLADVKLAHIPPSARIHDWMRQLTAALVYSSTERLDPKIRWDSAWVWSPDWLPSDSPKTFENDALLKQLLANKSGAEILARLFWQPGWASGPNTYPPEIYTFDLSFCSPAAFFRHKFFSTFTWYVGVEPSTGTQRALMRSVQLGISSYPRRKRR